jgi:hypothetical protein
MTTNQKWIAGILLALILGVTVWYVKDPTLGGYLQQKQPDDDTGPKPKPGDEWLGGTYDLMDKGRNTLDSSASLTTGTDYSSSWYRYQNGDWSFISAGSGSSGNNIESIPYDDGYIWLLAEETSAKYYYVDVARTLSKNTYIIEYRWEDVDGDTDKEFVFKCSLWEIPEPASGYPERTFYPYFKAESGQGTAANALQWETQPSDISSIGTSTTTKYIGWETKLTAEKRAVGIHKIVIEVNSTSTTKWEIDKVNVPGIGYLDGSLFDEVVLTSKTQYTYKIGTDFNDIVYWQVPSGTNNKFDNTVAVKFTLSSGDILQFTLYIYEWLYDRTSVSDNDAVICSA